MAEEKGVVAGANAVANINKAEMELVKNIIFKDGTDDELKLFFYECARRGVHPLDRVIFPIKRKDNSEEGGGAKRLTFQTSIDYLRSVAATAGDAGGMSEEFGPETSQEFPEWAKVTVKKWVTLPDGSCQCVEYSGTARWKEYYPGEKMGFQWRKMPYVMLSKCAEAKARRLAWPQILSGLYAAEELFQMDAGGSPAKDYSATITELPTGTTQTAASEARQHAETKTPKETLKDLLAQCAASTEERAALLKSVSSFTGKDGKEAYIKDVDKATDKWCMSVIERLKKHMEKNPPPPLPPDSKNTSAGEGAIVCAKNAINCDGSQWLDGGGWECVQTKEKCPYGEGEK